MAQNTASKVNETSRSAVGRDGVLDIAARLFREQGYGSVSLRKIAEAAGIKAGSIYYHFGSKDEIVAAVLDAGIRVVHASMRDAITDLRADTDGETALSPTSWPALLRAVGAVQMGVDLVMSGQARNAFAAIRPPGHHAEAARPMRSPYLLSV